MNVRVNSMSVKEQDEDLFFVDCKKCPDELTNMKEDPVYKSIISELRTKLYQHHLKSQECPDTILSQIERKLKTKEFFIELDNKKNKKWNRNPGFNKNI